MPILWWGHKPDHSSPAKPPDAFPPLSCKPRWTDPFSEMRKRWVSGHVLFSPFSADDPFFPCSLLLSHATPDTKLAGNFGCLHSSSIVCPCGCVRVEQVGFLQSVSVTRCPLAKRRFPDLQTCLMYLSWDLQTLVTINKQFFIPSVFLHY